MKFWSRNKLDQLDWLTPNTHSHCVVDYWTPLFLYEVGWSYSWEWEGHKNKLFVIWFFYVKTFCNTLCHFFCRHPVLKLKFNLNDNRSCTCWYKAKFNFKLGSNWINLIIHLFNLAHHATLGCAIFSNSQTAHTILFIFSAHFF